MDDAVKRAEELAALSDSKIITYRADGRGVNNVYSEIASKKSSRSDFNLISIGAASIPAGFYYIWPMAMP